MSTLHPKRTTPHFFSAMAKKPNGPDVSGATPASAESPPVQSSTPGAAKALKPKPKGISVIKRDGTSEALSLDKVLQRLRKLAAQPTQLDVDADDLALSVIGQIVDGVATEKLDELASQLCSSRIADHPHWNTLATRITINSHHKGTNQSFSETIEQLHAHTDVHGKPSPLVSDQLLAITTKNKRKINSHINYSRDYDLDYFGACTLLNGSYLMRINGKVVERPAHMFMRVALGIHGEDIKAALETYDLMSTKRLIHASPTLFSAGTPTPQLSSCFLVASKGDSIDEIFSTIKEMALISKYAGGIGVHVSNIRAKGSAIRGTNGVADGIVPMLRLVNDTALYVNQGGGKRPGAIAVYLEPWHADVMSFISLRKTTGDMKQRCLDLFTALWVPDMLVRRVKAGADWSLMCPDECPGLADVWGPEFDALYERYEAEGRARTKMPARDLWKAMCLAQVETGTPYLLYKDHFNAKSNQKNIGTIKSSNLCVAPETLVLTSEGQLPIKELAEREGGRASVWNGKVFSDVAVMRTGVQQPLLTVSFDNGAELRCTPYHKFFIETGADPSKKSVRTIVEAKDLVLDMKILRFEVPTINLPAPPEEERLKHPYTQGLFAADGTYYQFSEEEKHRCPYHASDEDGVFCKRHLNNVAAYESDGELEDGEPQCRANSWDDKPMLWLYGEKKALLPHVEWIYCNEDATQDRLNLALPHTMANKHLVPVNHDIATKLRWLEGYFDGDGCVLQNNGAKNIQVACTNKQFFIQVKALLQTLGINVVIRKARDSGVRSMPDGRGGSKDYMCATVWRFNIGLAGVRHLVELGYAPKRLVLGELRQVRRNGLNRFVRVAGVVNNEEVDDTFCFNEPLEHAGVFNGILTGQCCEIGIYSSEQETGVCNLSSLALPSYLVRDASGHATGFNFAELARVAGVATRNLNKVIDVNFYPVETARRSNMRHRPIGIGVQGLANVFSALRLPYDSPAAAALNKRIFATIYYGALDASIALAERDGPYETYPGSPTSQGLLQYDLWGVAEPETVDGLLDWKAIKARMAKHGLRNSLLVAPMPTASTSNILGFVESFEPYTSMAFTRRTLAGEFTLVCRELVDALLELGVWDKAMKEALLRDEGSVQGNPRVPEELRAVFKTAWEIKQRVMINMAADRGAYICQSASQNLFMADAGTSIEKLFNAHLYAHEMGLKTASYYLRTRPPMRIQAFTLEPSRPTASGGGGASSATPGADAQAAADDDAVEQSVRACSRDNPHCESCSG